MSKHRPLPALDCAWSIFEREDQNKPSERYAALLRELERRAPLFHLEPHLVSLAAELACFPQNLNDEEQAALTLLTLCTLIDLARGSTRTPCDGQNAYMHLKQLYRALAPETANALLEITRRFLDEDGAPEVIGSSLEDYTPLIRVSGYLYHQRLLSVETRLAERVNERILNSVKLSTLQISAARADVESRPTIIVSSDGLDIPVLLSAEQGSALELGASRPLSLISGGPGTGKTSIIVALLRVLVRLNISLDQIELAAPTGKAAWRMGESIRNSLSLLKEPHERDEVLMENPPTPQTLHRLLAYHPKTGLFRRHRNAPISANVVIIDESSMVDIYLMERLFNALRPDSQLILLGDADQLPSVSAGAVFKDLLNILPEHRITLTQSYRMREDDPDGRAILLFAREIRTGLKQERIGLGGGEITQEGSIKEKTALSELEWRGVEMLNWSQSEQWAFLDIWAKKYIFGDEKVQELRDRYWRFEEGRLCEEEELEISELFLHQSRAKILCITQNLETGVNKINDRFHRRFARFVQRDADYLVGEPVMMLHNDYDRMLFNGDQGLVLWGQWGKQDARPLIVFPSMDGGYRAFEMDALTGRIELCFAMTVHKSQGSEFERVALLLPAQRLPLLSRELIYTAVTRSKSSVVIVGQPELLSPETLRHHPRSSGFGEKIISK